MGQRGTNPLPFQTVYWYTVSVFYLTEHESHKASALRPLQPDAVWSSGSLGKIRMLRNFTDQLAFRCWELGMEGAFCGSYGYPSALFQDHSKSGRRKSTGSG